MYMEEENWISTNCEENLLKFSDEHYFVSVEVLNICWYYLFADTFKGSFYANPILDVPTTDVSLMQRY